MASGGGDGGVGVGVCNKRYRRSDGYEDGETSGRNKRCGFIGPSSVANDDGGESGAYMDDGAKTSDDDGAGAGEDYIYGYDDEDEADEQSDGDGDGDGDTAAAASACDDTEPMYVVLTEADVRARQDADAAKVAEVLSIPAVLLRHFKWRVGRVQEEWFTEERRVRGAVGLPLPPAPEHGDDELFLVPCARSRRPQVCGICIDPYPPGRTLSAGCGHYYFYLVDELVDRRQTTNMEVQGVI